MMDEVGDFAGADFEVLGRGLAAINDGGDAAGGAQLLYFAAARLRSRECFQRN